MAYYFFFLGSFSFLASFFSRFSTFFISSPAGNCSGNMPLLTNMSLTARLLSTCSFSMEVCPYKSFCCTLTEVISAAKSLAFILIVGRKSAKGRLSGTPNLRLSSLVSIRNSALSPLERMVAKPLLSMPLSYKTPESSFSVSASLVRAVTRS